MKINSRIAAFAVLLLVAAIVFGFYSVFKNSTDAMTQANAADYNIQKKRYSVSNMMTAVRERSHLLLRMFHEEDPFIRDDMSMSFSQEAVRFNQSIKTFNEEAQTRVQKDTFASVMEVVIGAAPKLTAAAAYLAEDEIDLAEGILFGDVLPQQDFIMDKLAAIFRLLEIEQQKNYQYFQEQQQLNQRKIILFTVLLGLLSLIIFALVRRSSSVRENELLTTQKDLNAQKAAMDEHSLVSITDIRGTIIYANDKFCEVSGYDRSDLVGANHRMLNSGNEPEEYWRQMYLMVSKGKVWNDEVCNQAKDGRFYWVDTTIVPLYDGTGKLSGYTSIRTDISKSKFVKQELIISKEEAEKATLAKTAFLATMSHEIRTPMNGVLGMAQLLQDTQLDDQQRDYLATISSSGNSLLSIINDILDFSKLEVDKAMLESIDFDLEKICSEVLELSAGNASESNVNFVFDYESGCPRGYVGDPSRIRQILINLMGNAVKFTEEGLIRLGVLDLGEGEFRVEVEDTGIGLKPEAREHLFDEFTQADNSTTREFGGTGLGLAITHKLVLLMGGEIGIISQFGVGSTFYFTLKLPISKTPKIEPDASLENVRILLVDDSETSRRIFKSQLEHMGTTPTVIKNPADALDVIRKAESDNDPFEIVVLDHNMQGISGLELGMYIRKSYSASDLKLFMLCSVGTKGDVVNFSSAGFDAGLNKPVRYEVIQSMLSALLKRCQGDQMITRYNMNGGANVVKKSELSFNAKILLVEDVEANQLVAKLMLQALGISVDIACNGLEAIEQYQKNDDYDLIFMDCRMPVLDGYEATMAIRQIDLEHGVESGIPIVALTANTGSDERKLCKAAGMDDIVTKPIDKTELVSALLRNLSESCQSKSVQNNDQPEVKSLLAPKLSEMVEVQQRLETLDEAVLESLREAMGESYQQMLDITFNDLQACIDNLMQATAESPISDVTLWAHSVKSLAGNIGAMRLNALAKELEANSKDSGVDSLSDTFVQAINDLHNEYEHLVQEMELAVS